MTAIELAIDKGEYKEYHFMLPDVRGHARHGESSPESCRRFLMRVLVKAVLDFCALKPTDPYHADAKEWLMGNTENCPMTVEDLCSIVDMDWALPSIKDLVEKGPGDLSHIGRVRRLLRDAN